MWTLIGTGSCRRWESLSRLSTYRRTHGQRRELADHALKRFNLIGTQWNHFSRLHAFRQPNRAIGNSHEANNSKSQLFKQTPHQAVAAFVHNESVPITAGRT